MKNFLLVLLIASISSFAQKLQKGIYHAELLLRDKENISLPFTLSVINDTEIVFINGEEEIKTKEIKFKNDSFYLKMPIFDSEIHFTISEAKLKGYWYNFSRNDKNKIPFQCTKGSKRFTNPQKTDNRKFEGRWEVTFGANTKDSSKAVGVFNIKDGIANGTFLTETGDFRYLEGITSGNEMYLSCFDGSHAFLFKSELNTDGTLSGEFYSGSHWKENWKAKKNQEFELRNPNEITKLKNENFEISFSFRNTNGKLVQLSDEKFKNKVVIIQLMGSWCPNCMDESNYFSDLYRKQRDKGLEIISICFERTNDTAKARQNIMRLKERFSIEYELLVTGLSGKEKASETFPMLSGISAFPTTLFLDRNKKIRKIHTGFAGPATGAEYDLFTNETQLFINSLLKE